jgi:hypothetical protein
MAGNLDREFGPDHNVAGPVTIFVPPEISGPLGAGVGRALQAQGIKVVLSILSHTVEAVASNGIHHKYSVGWSTMTAKDNKQLVSEIGQLKEQFNFDGIDIDDEFGPAYTPRGPGTAKNFYDTVQAIRSAFPKPFVISNAVYQMSPYGDLDKYEKFPELGHLMTYCATMGYGNHFDSPSQI